LANDATGNIGIETGTISISQPFVYEGVGVRLGNTSQFQSLIGAPVNKGSSSITWINSANTIQLWTNGTNCNITINDGTWIAGVGNENGASAFSMPMD
jgi:hypothetical protein